MMKILLVEDEGNVVSFLKRSLEESGYEVSVAPDGPAGLQMAESFPFDMILLDIMLPGMSGLEICRRLRKQEMETPIIMLTALGSTENIVTGLDMGADDYLVKPFHFAELEARIRTLSRRRASAGTAAAAKSVLKMADLELDTESQLVARNGQAISLTATEYRLLSYLMKNPNRVLSRVDILEQVWGVSFNMGTNVVDVYINYLRKKIDKDHDPKLLHTVIGMGYILKEVYRNEDSD